MSDQLRLAEMLVARLCHDLSGPVATAAGVLDMARSDAPSMMNEAVELAIEAAGTLSLRLRLYRAAWTGEDTPSRASEVTRLATGIPIRRNTSLDLSRLDTATAFSAAGRRLFLNALLLGVEGLPGGGVLLASGSAGADIIITIEGPGAAWPAGLAACLADEATALRSLAGPRGVQAPLTALIARQSDLRLSLLLASGRTDRPPPLLLALGG